MINATFIIAKNAVNQSETRFFISEIAPYVCHEAAWKSSGKKKNDNL
ncbi:hypothetical protein ABID99_004968 [Mucilaginibacter sp. OAE612]